MTVTNNIYQKQIKYHVFNAVTNSELTELVCKENLIKLLGIFTCKKNLIELLGIFTCKENLVKLLAIFSKFTCIDNLIKLSSLCR
jgi:hypothetical protein